MGARCRVLDVGAQGWRYNPARSGDTGSTPLQEKDEGMAPDKINMRVWLMLAVLGAVLCLIGWYRYVSFT